MVIICYIGSFDFRSRFISYFSGTVCSHRAGRWQDVRDPSDGHHGGRPAHARRQQFVSDAGCCGGGLHAASVDDVYQVLLHGAVRFADRGLRHAVLQLSRQAGQMMQRTRPHHGPGIPYLYIPLYK